MREAEYRTHLTRILAEIDGLLAEAEEIAGDLEDEDHDAALDFLIEFQEVRQRVEVTLRNERSLRN